MEEIGKSMLEKVSSYNIFNNFFPGIVFCYMIRFFTDYELDKGSTWENLFLYYFCGLVISRIGSIVFGTLLLKIKIKNKKNRTKENYIERSPYQEYCKASENNSFIKMLNETNNMYRTMIAVFACVLVIKTYELLSVYWIEVAGLIGTVLEVLFLVTGMILFIISYKKQTDYIRKRVQNCMIEENKK